MDLYIFNEASRAAVYGIGTYIRELTAALRDSDVNICVVHLRTANPIEEADEQGNIRHLYIPAPVSINSNSDMSSRHDLYYRNVVFLLRLQNTNNENLIFHLNNNQCSALAEELKKTFVCKIVVSIHYLDWSLTLLGNINRFRKIITAQETEQDDALNKASFESYRKEKALFEKVDQIICLSDNTFEILHYDYEIKPDKVTVIYNGLTDSQSTSADRQVLRQKYRIKDMSVILFAGRLNDIKGLKYALQAFRIVLNAYPDCRFIIAGNGNYDLYMKECEDIWMNISWTGLINSNKLNDLYAIADIGVMPSLHEQCSYVAIEMMMHGLPIIGSASAGLKEMIIDRETGFHVSMVEYDDRVEINTTLMAEKILYLIENPDERKRMGQNARRRYEEHYSNVVFSKKMLYFLARLNENTTATPKIIHQIWEGRSEPLPDFYQKMGETWKKHHPDWQYEFWDNARMNTFIKENFPEWIEVYANFKYDVQRWDVIRYLILYKIGGMYVDFDYECLKPFDNFIRTDNKCYFAMEPDEHCRAMGGEKYFNNALMITPPCQPFFEYLITSLRTMTFTYTGNKFHDVLSSTGPLMLYNVYKKFIDCPSIDFLPSELVSPLSKTEARHHFNQTTATEKLHKKLEKAFAVHYFCGSWLT